MDVDEEGRRCIAFVVERQRKKPVDLPAIDTSIADARTRRDGHSLFDERIEARELTPVYVTGGIIVFRQFAVPDIGQVLLAAMNGSESMQVRGWRNAGLISLHDKIFDKQCDRAILNVQAGDLMGDTSTGGEEDVLPGWDTRRTSVGWFRC